MTPGRAAHITAQKREGKTKGESDEETERQRERVMERARESEARERESPLMF